MTPLALIHGGSKKQRDIILSFAIAGFQYPWIKTESNMTKEEWEKHRDWVLNFCGTIVGEPIENGRYYRVKAPSYSIH